MCGLCRLLLYVAARHRALDGAMCGLCKLLLAARHQALDGAVSGLCKTGHVHVPLRGGLTSITGGHMCLLTIKSHALFLHEVRN